MSRRIIVLVLGLSLIVASIGGLVLITYREEDRQIGAFIDLIPGNGCSIFRPETRSSASAKFAV